MPAVNEVGDEDPRIPLGTSYSSNAKALHPMAQRLTVRFHRPRLPLGLKALGALLVLQGLDEILHIAV